MSLGKNIQYLRKMNKLKQDQLAEKMGVSRQTISRWESDEVTPELPKLVEMCSLFSCNMDELVRGDLTSKGEIYSDVTIRKVPAFRMAKYAIISQEPEDDVLTHMKNWAEKSGLLASDSNAKLIGWDFPFPILFPVASPPFPAATWRLPSSRFRRGCFRHRLRLVIRMQFKECEQVIVRFNRSIRNVHIQYVRFPGHSVF